MEEKDKMIEQLLIYNTRLTSHMDILVLSLQRLLVHFQPVFEVAASQKEPGKKPGAMEMMKIASQVIPKLPQMMPGIEREYEVYIKPIYTAYITHAEERQAQKQLNYGEEKEQ